MPNEVWIALHLTGGIYGAAYAAHTLFRRQSAWPTLVVNIAYLGLSALNFYYMVIRLQEMFVKHLAI